MTMNYRLIAFLINVPLGHRYSKSVEHQIQFRKTLDRDK